MATLSVLDVLPSALNRVPFKLGDHANDFLENRLGDVAEELGSMNVPIVRASDGSYDNELTQGVTILMTASMEAQHKKFQTALEKFTKKKSWDSPNGVKFQDVLETLQKAYDSYSTKPTEGCLARLDQCLHNFHTLKRPVESWLRLLPSESWQGSLICGGLKVIFDAAAQLHQIREDVGKALEQVPITIEKVQSFIELYNEQVITQKFAEELYIVLLGIVEKCLDWFSTHAAKKFFGVLILNDEYGRKLRERCQRLTILEARISDKATLGHMRQSARTERLVKNVFGTMHSMLHNQEKQHGAVQHMEQLLLKTQSAEREKEQALLRNKEIEELWVEEWKKNLMHWLPYDHLQCLTDLTNCLSIQPTSYADTRDRAAWILRSQEIATWLSSTKSELLLVNGQELHHGNGESAVSMFSAMLIHSLDMAGSEAVNLYWFAGQNPDSDPVTMAIALLGQLLRNGNAVLSIEQVQDIEGVYPTVNAALSNPIAVLTLLCRWLQEQLNTMNIYIILDSISCYEDHRTNDLRQIYGMLQMISKAWQGEHHLKVLITSPTQSTCVGTYDDVYHPAVLNADQIIDKGY